MCDGDALAAHLIECEPGVEAESVLKQPGFDSLDVISLPPLPEMKESSFRGHFSLDAQQHLLHCVI